MRRFLALIAIPLLACLVLVGCGSSKPKPAAPADNTNLAVTATGAFGMSPKVTIPKAKADNALTVKTLIKGNGPALTKTDAFVGNYAVYIWSGKTHKLAESTFQSKNPALFSGQLLPGLETALQGKKMGSRVLDRKSVV